MFSFCFVGDDMTLLLLLVVLQYKPFASINRHFRKTTNQRFSYNCEPVWDQSNLVFIL